MNIILFDQMPADQAISRTDERGRHIISVLRAVPGDQVLMGLIDGPSGMATITGITDQLIHIEWDPKTPARPLYPLELVVAQVRPICMKRVLREAVSLGVSRIHVCGADTAERSYGQSHLWTKGEYRKFLIHGAQQAVSTRIPECIVYRNVNQLTFEAGTTRLMLDNIDPVIDLMHAQISEQTASAVLAVGPERGWSDRERAYFEGQGFVRVGLGSRVLRTETACSVGLGITLGRMGCLS
ncbi:MAG: 16S rRNA (uracil(1498)-N(3))-methyltransferase [Spirochaetia bacterium]|jgi:16S rRNA (uracil1498-N3)-methyltransferase|nr:16S rRNA (uracil(1498)-N(3))-methyltransferase [Spirochaetia bacterium]MCF7940102.1 16S rRNA (uracil(1498)-N(3))-methyltransferase [Spirochaetia bacterium]